MEKVTGTDLSCDRGRLIVTPPLPAIDELQHYKIQYMEFYIGNPAIFEDRRRSLADLLRFSSNQPLFRPAMIA